MTKVTYRFDAIDGGTRLTVRQDDFGAPEAAREHAQDWERVLNWLRVYLSRSEPSGAPVNSRPDRLSD